jgi:hypothetical protein
MTTLSTLSEIMISITPKKCSSVLGTILRSTKSIPSETVATVGDEAPPPMAHNFPPDVMIIFPAKSPKAALSSITSESKCKRVSAYLEQPRFQRVGFVPMEFGLQGMWNRKVKSMSH